MLHHRSFDRYDGAAGETHQPPNSFLNVPTNTLVQMMFDGPISLVSTGQVTLQVSGSPIPITRSLINGDRGLQLTPSVPLAPNTAHTIPLSE